MKKVIRKLGLIIKWIFIIIISVEILSFIIITISNYVIYGHAREGSRVKYDPHTLFLHKDGPRRTASAESSTCEKEIIIWMFGGSTMRGDTEDDRKTIPGFLSQQLNQAKTPFCYRVVNYGENSFNSILEVNYLQKLLIEETSLPDIIFFYDGANDCSYFSQHRTPYAHHGYRRFQGIVESYHKSFFGLFKSLNAAIYTSSTRELSNKMMQTLVSLEKEDPIVKDFIKKTEKRYDYIYELSRRHGIRFIMILQPIWWTEDGTVYEAVKKEEKQINQKEKLFPVARHNFALLYRLLSKKLENKPYFVNFKDILTSRAAPVYQPDGVHLRDEGRSMVSTELLKMMKIKGLY